MPDPPPAPESQEPRKPPDLYLDSFDDEPGFARVDQMKCPLCSQSNPENQKYCGFCGVPLHAPLLTPQPRNSDFVPPSLEELHFLRKRNPENDGSEQDRRGWLYLIIGIAVLLAGFAAFERYYEPDSEPRAAVVPARPVNEQPTPVATPAAPQSPPAVTQPQAVPAPEPTPVAVAPPTVHEKLVPASRITPATSPAEDGSQELADALRNLSPTSPPHNPAKAAALLWKSVGKGNVEAEVTLADLYLRGEGVSRSCEQARLLLRTAAGKGSSDAATRLRNLVCK